MTDGFIDSASLSQLVQCFDRSYADQYSWSYTCTVDLTALLLGTDHQRIAPGMQPFSDSVVDEQSWLVDALLSAGIVKRMDDITATNRQKAIVATRRSIGRRKNLVETRQRLEKTLDSPEFGKWIDWVESRALDAHAQRFGGLIDADFESYVARILERDLEEIADIRQRTADVSELQSMRRSHGQDYETAIKGYVCSALIRGMYHREVANLQSLQLFQHPIREHGSVSDLTYSASAVGVTNTSRAIAYMVIHGAAAHPKLQSRLGWWVKNIESVRRVVRSGDCELDDRPTAVAAVRTAAKIAKTANIQMADSRWEKWVDVGLRLGVGILTAYWIEDWRLAAPAGLSAQAVVAKVGVTKGLFNKLHLRNNRLRKLGAGLVKRGWTEPKKRKHEMVI